MSEESEISLNEVKKYNHNQKTWIVIHNCIYDVTAFLSEHPGGEEVLLEQAGKDGSEAFEDVGHSKDARELMLKYKIGEVLRTERKPVKEKNTDLFSNDDESSGPQSSIKNWILPLTVGIVATILYKLFFH